MKTTHTRLIKENVAPEGAAAIGVVNNSGQVVGYFPLGTLAHSYGTKRFSIGILADVHFRQATGTTFDNANLKFEKALAFFENYGVAAVGIAGDITYERKTAEYELFKVSYDKYKSKFPIYTCMGNHDVYWDNSGPEYVSDLAGWKNYTGQDGYNTSIKLTLNTDNSWKVKNFYITTLSCSKWQPTKSNLYYSDDDITWLEGKLAAQTDGITFLFIHIPFADRAGDFGYAYWPASVLKGTNLTRLRNLADNYPNAIWICGHTHDSWEHQGIPYTTTNEGDKAELKNANIVSPTLLNAIRDNYDANVWPCNGATRNSAWHLHLPSSNNVDFYEDTTKKEGQFAVLDVYDDCVIVKGYSFDNTVVSNSIPAPIKLVPIAQYRLNFDNIGATEGGGSTGGNTGGSTTTRSYIDETNKIIYGYVGETIDIGFAPEVFTRQNYDVFGASTTDTSVDNRIAWSGTKLSFKAEANKNWKGWGSVEGLSESTDETKCWFWTFKRYKHSGETDIKYKTIIYTNS